jgi:eukaryotic-like serine/threonine-protein kinase
MIACPTCQTGYDDETTRYCGRCGSDMRRAPDGGGPDGSDGIDPLIGRVIDGRYRVLAKLGQGGMGSVYRVEHLAMGKQAAMKLLHPALTQDVEIGRRFRREAEAVSRLSHPNTVAVFDFGDSKGFMYLVMELIKGEDLGAIIRRDGPMPFDRVRSILVQICDALSEAHEAGVVHRDLKPENLLVTRARDGHDVLKVLDFGLAKLRDSEELNQVTARGSLVGTPFYMSPEQIRGEDLDARSDLYSLGAVMYRLLTGEHPFTGSTPVAVLTQHLTEELDKPSERRPDLGITPQVDKLVMKAMARDREKRWPSADDLRAAIEAIPMQSGPRAALSATRRDSDREPTGTSPTESPLKREDLDAWERSLKRRRWMGLMAVPLLAAVVGVAAIVWVKTSGPRARDVEAEPNNSAGQANWIASERTIRGHIGERVTAEQSDIDFFQFNVGAGTHVLRVELTGIPTMDLKLELFDARGHKLVESDGGAVGDGELVPNVRLEPGDHYVGVREVWVSGRPATEDLTNWYTLTASWKPLEPNLESEPDDSPEQAVPLALDQPTRGYLGRAGDVDYFYLRGEGGGKLSGTLSGIEGVDTRVVVLPPGSQAGPPGPLPPGAKIFDNAGVGEPEKLEGIPWPAGGPGPILVVQRKEAKPDGKSTGPGGIERRAPLVGLDVPYSLTVRLGP